jgi:copper oxidase (laccase) domain-containing protein
VAEPADALDSKSSDGNIVRVQLPPRPQIDAMGAAPMSFCTFYKSNNDDEEGFMPKKSYTRRDTTPDRVLESRYVLEDKSIEVLVSNRQDGNMDPRFSDDALTNFHSFLKKHRFSPAESFSPALGQNYRIITIDETNEEKYAGQFIENGRSREDFLCDAVIAMDATIPVSFRVGDCPVVLIVGEIPQDKKILSLVHAGRAELQADILTKSVNRLITDHRMHPRSGTAYIFPHICKHCYKLEYVDEATKEKAERFLTFVDGYYYLDLMEWLKQQLKEAGIERVSTAFFRCTAGISPICKSRLLHDTEKFSGFFSNYRSCHYGDPKGRFLVVARIIDKKSEAEKEDDFYET